MELNAEMITTACSVIGSVLVSLWRAHKFIKKEISKMIATQTQFIAKQVTDLKQQNTFMAEQINELKRETTELKAILKMEFKSNAQFEESVKAALAKNNELLSEFKIAKGEWISENLMKIKGQKPKGE